jgi:hypothetical protein
MAVASLIEKIRDFLKDNIRGTQPGDPPVPGIIANIDNVVDQLRGIEVSPTNNGLTNWLDILEGLITDVELRDTLVLRALQLKAPRLAEALVLAKLVKVEFRDEPPRAFAFKIDWDHLDDFLRDPAATSRDTLLGQIQTIRDLRAAQAMIGLWLTAPKQLLLMEYAEQGFASLPDPQAQGTVDLNELIRDLINSPLALNISQPLVPPLDLETLKDMVKDARDAGLGRIANYVAILGPDAFTVPDPTDPGRLDGFGIEIKLKDPKGAEFTQNIGGGLSFFASAPGGNELKYRLVMENGSLAPAQEDKGAIETGVSYQPTGGKTLIGPPGGTRIEIGPAKLAVRLQPKGAPLFTVRAGLERLAFVFSTDALGLLKKIASVPDEIRFESQAAISYVHGAGLQGSGGASAGGLPPLSAKFTVPLDLKLGGKGVELKVERVGVEMAIKLEPVDGAPELFSKVSLRFGASGTFGPVSITADGMGVWFGKWKNSQNQVEFGDVVTPTAIGVSLKAGPVSGGGFLAETGKSEYAGGLSLKVIGIGVGAFALFGEANGSASFAGILGIRLPPPGVQIGFGFAVTGLGGLVGINRRVDTDVLREQLASGTSADILFCADPSKNALTVIGQLPRLFPPEPGVFLIGPTFQISWLELLTLDAGVFIEMPGPRQIFIAGSARMVIGPKDLPLVYLRMDFVGGIDLVKRLIYFDAALVNSHVMQVFKITGGIALRIAYGDNGYFLFSVGGFHPSFNPGGLELPKLARAGTCASIDIAWFKLENYFALTSCTFQLGASVEAGIELGPISAHGWLRFDALIQFEPFYFVAEIDAGFDVEVFGASLCGVRLQGKLSGPGPLVIEARASVKVLFARVSESVTIRLGSGPAAVPKAIDLLNALAGEFAKLENTRGDGEDKSVVFRNSRATAVNLLSGRATADNDAAVVQAVGAIVWEQKRVPFGLDLQRFEGAPLAGSHHLILSTSESGKEDEHDWFGMGTYLNLDSSEALNNGRFTEQRSGIRIPLGETISGKSAPCGVELELVKLPKRERSNPFSAGSYMSASLMQMQAERGGAARLTPGNAIVQAHQEKWVNIGPGGSAGGALSGAQAFLVQRGGGGIARPAAVKPVSLGGVF